MPICLIQHCGKPAKAKAYCRAHYQKHVYRAKNPQRVLDINRQWRVNQDNLRSANHKRTRTVPWAVGDTSSTGP